MQKEHDEAFKHGKFPVQCCPVLSNQARCQNYIIQVVNQKLLLLLFKKSLCNILCTWNEFSLHSSTLTHHNRRIWGALLKLYMPNKYATQHWAHNHFWDRAGTWQQPSGTMLEFACSKPEQLKIIRSKEELPPPFPLCLVDPKIPHKPTTYKDFKGTGCSWFVHRLCWFLSPAPSRSPEQLTVFLGVQLSSRTQQPRVYIYICPFMRFNAAIPWKSLNKLCFFSSCPQHSTTVHR